MSPGLPITTADVARNPQYADAQRAQAELAELGDPHTVAYGKMAGDYGYHPRPLLDVEILATDGQSSITRTFLVDTGSPITIFHTEWMRTLGVSAGECAHHMRRGGFSDAPVGFQLLRPLTLRAVGYPVSIEPQFVDPDDGVDCGVLGSDFLRWFRVTFDQGRYWIQITPCNHPWLPRPAWPL